MVTTLISRRWFSSCITCAHPHCSHAVRNPHIPCISLLLLPKKCKSIPDPALQSVCGQTEIHVNQVSWLPQLHYPKTSMIQNSYVPHEQSECVRVKKPETSNVLLLFVIYCSQFTTNWREKRLIDIQLQLHEKQFNENKEIWKFNFPIIAYYSTKCLSFNITSKLFYGSQILNQATVVYFLILFG